MAQPLRRQLRQIGKAGIARGVPPSWFGYRWVQRETLDEHFRRLGERPGAGALQVVHPPAVAANPLPVNVASRDQLPDERGWWRYSFRDVPSRASGQTTIATLPNGRVTWYRDPAKRDEFHPAVLAADGRALDLREVRFRPPHARALRESGPPARLRKATWILERVYDNHSHWLTAHLPKIVLLRERGALEDVLLPPQLSPAMEGSLRLLGLDPGAFPSFDPARPLAVDELTVLETDRFRPELLQPVQDAYAAHHAQVPHRRVYVSRARAPRRRLVNEEALRPLLEGAGFEWIHMEELSFEEQVRLMGETAILFGAHGAGLTNMLFCPPGADVVEIADLSFPNPNFYALACAARHRYWLLEGKALGDAHPLERDMSVDVAAVDGVLTRLLGG